MLIVGLTGSIGMGKSTVAAHFRRHGIAVCDADAEVHKLYEGAAVPLIEAAFPGTTRSGKVDRQRLAAALLADPGAFKRLEAIVHPLVFDAERASCTTEAAKGAAVAVLEIPLLLETGGEARVDVVVVLQRAADNAARARPAATGHDGREAGADSGPADARRGEAGARRFRCGHRRDAGRDRASSRYTCRIAEGPNGDGLLEVWA